MAPTPVDNAPQDPQPTTGPSKGGNSRTAAIVAISVFAFFAVASIVTFIAWYMHRRAERNKLPPENRPVSYHPFRTESVKSGLLANAAPSPEDDKSSMFSRQRSHSNVSLYVDTEVHDKRTSMDTVSLIPLHITPAEEVRDPMDRTTSVGSGVSGTSRYSRASRASLTPVSGEEAGLGATKGRPRSTSAASARYYEVNNTDAAPQIPKIVHTPSP